MEYQTFTENDVLQITRCQGCDKFFVRLRRGILRTLTLGNIRTLLKEKIRIILDDDDVYETCEKISVDE